MYGTLCSNYFLSIPLHASDCMLTHQAVFDHQRAQLTRDLPAEITLC